MKNIVPAIVAILFSLPATGQSGQGEERQRGFAGDPSCRTYFAAVWMARVSPESPGYATQYRLETEQLKWWKEQGTKKNPGLCYLEPTPGGIYGVTVACANCPSGWDSSFRWLVFERTKTVENRASLATHDRTIGRAPNPPTSSSGRPGSTRTPVTLTDDSRRVEESTTILNTDVTVFGGGTPVRPPSESDRQLYHFSARNQVNGRESAKDYFPGDRKSLQSAIEFLAKNDRENIK